MTDEKDPVIGFRIPDDLLSVVRRIADRDDRTISWVIREYLRRGLEKDRLLKRKR